LISFKVIGCAALLFAGVSFSSCENNLADVANLTSNKNQLVVDKSYGVEMIYSDSAIVKNKIIAPEIFHYNTKAPYYEMKKGIVVIFFDINQKEYQRIVADYAIWKEFEKMIILKKNVVVSNTKGETLKSDEIIWDQNKHEFNSDKMVTLTSPNSSGTPTVLYGDGFTSDEGLKMPNLIRARGNVNITNQPGF
jgi:LPS export ABC transporter protein LptC